MKTLKEEVDRATFQHVKKALIETGGNLVKTQKLLGIYPRSLYDLREKFPELKKYVKWHNAGRRPKNEKQEAMRRRFPDE